LLARLRQTFHEFAGRSAVKSQWARAYYDLQIHAAVRALAFKWIRILFRCWKDGKPAKAQLALEGPPPLCHRLGVEKCRRLSEIF
jgi:hypothetical protein